MQGELWLGLDAIHKLTSERNYKLQVTLKDFDNQIYTAVYELFKVLFRNHVIHIEILYYNHVTLKVGPGAQYRLAIGWFNSALSTLGDSFTTSSPSVNLNEMMFSTKYGAKYHHQYNLS